MDGIRAYVLHLLETLYGAIVIHIVDNNSRCYVFFQVVKNMRVYSMKSIVRMI